MLTHSDLRDIQTRSLKMQSWIRQQTFSPESRKTLRRFSSWEVSELILGLNQNTFRGKMAADPNLPAGMVEPDGTNIIVDQLVPINADTVGELADMGL